MTVPRHYDSLRDYLALLERRDQLHRIATPVEANEELAAIVDRVAKYRNGGPGLLFERIVGSRWPVAANLFGSLRRSAWALGVEHLDELSSRFRDDLSRHSAAGSTERLQQLVADAQFHPQLVATPACQEVIERQTLDLSELPALRNFPDDGGRYLTLPLVFTADPSTGRSNCGIYRLLVLGPDRLAVAWHDGSDGQRNYCRHLAAGGTMPIAIALGGDPALLYSAAMRLPSILDETVFAGYLRHSPVALTRCLTNDLKVPAAAELVLEGEIIPGEFHAEGPFGNHTGYYQPLHKCPVVRITTLTRRHEPIIPTTVIGQPPMEDCYLAKALERLLLPLLQLDFPEITEMCMPLETIFHGVTMIAIDAARGADRRTLLKSLAQSPWLAGARLLVLFDQSVDVHNPGECYWRALNTVDAAGDMLQLGRTIVIDATGHRVNPHRAIRSDAMQQLVEQRWAEYGLKDLLDGN